MVNSSTGSSLTVTDVDTSVGFDVAAVVVLLALAVEVLTLVVV